VHLLIDGLFNLGQGGLRMRRSPLGHGRYRFLRWLLPLLVQLFGGHVNFSLSASQHNSFPLRQFTTSCLFLSPSHEQADSAKI
jgi:hypothetical protein